MKKIFTLFDALMMVFSMNAATKTIYCKMAQSWWKADGAAVGAYYWGTGSGPAWPGVRMTPVSGETDLWSIDIDTDKFQNIIFTRVNGSGTVSDWGAKTADLTVPTDDKNLYTITSTSPVWGSPGVAGNWSVYAPDAPKTYKDITITIVANATPKIHYWEGGDKVVGTEWDAKPEMVATGEENTYSYTIKEVDEATGVKYLVVVGDVQSADQQAFEDVNKNFKELLPQVSVMGVKSWDGDKMTVADDYLTASVTLTLEAAKDYELKLTVNGEWFGSNAITITKDNNSAAFAENGDGNGKLTTDLAGDYVFTYTYATKTLVVTYPEPEYALEETIEISNLTTETLTVGEATYLQLTGRNDMLDSDVQLFLNNYTGEDKEYEVNVENSLMTFGGIELTVVEGAIAQATDPEKGKVYTGRVIASAEEEGEVMLVALDLVMYSTPAIEVEVAGATARVDEETGSLVLNGEWTKDGVTYPVFVTVAGYEDVEFKEYEGAQISELQIGDDTNWLDFAVANAVAVFKDGQNISIEGEYTSWATGTTYSLTISGKLPVVEEPEVEKPEPTYTENNLNPYAFGLESVLSDDKTTLTVTYRLNNSNATSVNVLVYNGEDIVASIPGTTTIGKNTVEIATADLPAGVELTWSVIVNGTSVEAPTAETKIYSFYHPSGVDIDINPENETFGLLLVNEGMHSVKSKTEGYVSAQFGAGIFAFTPSFDLIPNGELPGYNGGIEFTTTRADGTGTAYAPRRIRISEDGRIFVTSLNTDGNYLWEVNPDNMNEWTTVFKGTLNDQRELVDAEGNFVAAPNNGFDVKGSGENLQLAMYSVNLSGITAAAMSGFRLHEYNLGTATEWATAPSKALVEGKYAINYTGTQVEYDNEGGFWIASYRGTASDANPGLVHINADGVEDAKLVWNNVRQAGIRFNKDFTKLVVAGNNGAAKKATIYTISKDANGAPVLTQEAVVDMAAVGNNLNDFAWDYAGNLYACGNSSEKLAAWAMPYSGEVETPAASKYAFQLEGKTEVEYEVYEDEITNLVIDYDNMLLIGGPSANLEVDVYLGLGDYDRNTDKFALLPESSVAIRGIDATFVEGWASVDGIAQTANAVVRCVWNEMNIELHLAMSAATIEPTVVVVENAAIEIEKVLLFGDMYDYALKMTGTWTDAEDLNYPVLVEVPVYYPEATEPYEIYSTVTVGGWDDDENWLGFGEGYLTITEEGNKITAAGIVENAWAGIAIDITISGTITPTGLENATVTVKSVKMIKNGQLVIEKDGVQYNAQGATIK